jgi:predicted DNA binding protein
MLKTLKRLVFLAALFLTILFVVFIINQTSQLVMLASGIHETLGNIVLFFLIALYIVLLAIPLAALISRPSALIPPEDQEGEQYLLYIRRLVKRLQNNPALSEMVIKADDLTTVSDAVTVLNKKADEKIKDTASNIFVITAISQYGALDAMIVIIFQLRMIWQVALIYNQRPNLRDLIYLYSNVFATAFLATKIENLEILEDQLEPVIASVMGSSLSSLTPAFNTAANIITNSVIQGSANAFLTLRVGVITRHYCASLVKPERNSIRSTAIVQAASMLAVVLGESTYKVTKAVLKATAKAGKRPFRYGQDLMTKTSKKTWETGKLTLHKSEELAKKIGESIKSRSGKFKYRFLKPKADNDE